MWGQIIITPPRWCSVNNYVRAGAWHPSEIRAPFLCFVTIPPRLSTTTYSRFLCSGTWSSRTTSLSPSLSPDWQHLPQIVSSQLSPCFLATLGPEGCWLLDMPPTLSKSQKLSHKENRFKCCAICYNESGKKASRPISPRVTEICDKVDSNYELNNLCCGA